MWYELTEAFGKKTIAYASFALQVPTLTLIKFEFKHFRTANQPVIIKS